MLRRALIVVAVTTLVLVVIGVAVVRARVRAAGDRLVEIARAADALTFERPSHRPEPGTLGERFDEVYAVIGKLRLGFEQSCIDASLDVIPVSQITPECERSWAADRAWSEGLFRASRAERWSRVRHFHGLDYAEVPQINLIYTWAMVPVQISLRKLPPDEVLELCVDIMALLRDQSALADLQTVQVGLDQHARSLEPCRQAARRASPETRAWAADALSGVNQTWPRTGAWLPFLLVNRTRESHSVLTAEQRSRLPTSARSKLVELMVHESVMRAVALPQRVALYEQIQAALALEPARRDAVVRGLQSRAATAWNPAAVDRWDYVAIFHREEQRRVELDTFIELLRSGPEPSETRTPPSP
ncbi:MAG: hypothetical protein JNK82_15515 [Myxococcaceae bacterium]|nr:hypothetical protein [Myxococcaceae bacterium]